MIYDDLLALLVRISCHFQYTKMKLSELYCPDELHDADALFADLKLSESIANDIKHKQAVLEEVVNQYINGMRLSKSIIDNEASDPTV